MFDLFVFSLFWHLVYYVQHEAGNVGNIKKKGLTKRLFLMKLLWSSSRACAINKFEKSIFGGFKVLSLMSTKSLKGTFGA